MSTIEIHLADEKDLPILEEMMYELHYEHHLSCPEHFKPAQEILQEKKIGEYLNCPEGLVYIASLKGEMIGFITGHMSELISMVSKRVYMGSIDELYVRPAFRCQGIGYLLLSRLTKAFENFGVEQIFVEVWSFNHAAQQLYQKLGFEHHIYYLRKAI
jgi:ribosomal protein S18 acetylase RimI-like enzyme